MVDQPHLLWVSKARDNLKWASDNLPLTNFPLVCFLSQQAVELLLKGLIYSKKQIPPKTHNLVRLENVCAELGFDLKQHQEDLALLSEFYFETRYPDEVLSELNEQAVAEKALKSAKSIFDKVLPLFGDL
jgi:HEPN domain-containing protein